jgi:hypothetical protein
MTTTSLEEQIAECKRELKVRRACYPALVKSGKLSAEQARYQIACLYDAIKTLRQVEYNRKQLVLFPQPGEGVV